MSVRFLCLWFACVGAVAAASRAELRGLAQDRCAFDGRAIEPAARVERVERGGQVRRAGAAPEHTGATAPAEARIAFCGVECALCFAERRPATATTGYEVRDALDLGVLDAAIATFVRTPAPGGGRPGWRAFRDAAAAIEHAAGLGGVPVPDPFAAPPRETTPSTTQDTR